ncbi:MAG TPA: carboxypeptidase M32 [Rubrobacteraceae bacterium]|nr:carboxypeptidase M32 [Rubrobacteraceae bacterium]
MITENEGPIRDLKDRLAAISDIGGASSLLFWDQHTHMPEGGVAGRAEQMATLSRLAHEMLVDIETGRLLDSSGEPDPSSEKGALIRRARHDYERATRLPAELVAEITRTTTLAEPAWVKAREESDWSLFAPHLEKIVRLQREAAEALGYDDHPYDALLDGYEPGAKKKQLEVMFEELKKGIVPLVQAVAEREEDGGIRAAPLYGTFGEAEQEEFGKAVIGAFGYDWERGRQDHSVHPFCINFGPGDVRITTRFDKGWLAPALFGTMHEAGHALYEQGINPDYARTPLGGGTSMGINESQSRLWENLVGRSRPFWAHYYPKLQEVFPEALGGVDSEAFYRAINVLEPSKIRVEADEVTYNLHILLRFELEVALLEDKLSIADLPSAWNAKMEEYLGISPENDAEGVLQDIHWSNGVFGYFPTYTIGNVLSVQFFDEAVKQRPEIPAEMREGEFSTLHTWLEENIYRHGSRYYPDESVEQVTGRPLDTASYLRYLKNKFGELYDLD